MEDGRQYGMNGGSIAVVRRTGFVVVGSFGSRIGMALDTVASVQLGFPGFGDNEKTALWSWSEHHADRPSWTSIGILS